MWTLFSGSINFNNTQSEELGRQLGVLQTTINSPFGYGEGLTAENALKWKAMNQFELEKMKSDIEYRKSRAAGGKGSGKTQITNTLNTQYTRLKKNAGKMLPTIGKNADPMAQGASIRIPPKEQKFFKSYFEDVVPTAFDAHYANASEEERNEGVGKYDLSNATVNLLEKVAKEKEINHIDAVIWYCQKNNLEPDSVGRLITKGLKEKIEANARELNFLEKTATLPI